jgi:hypothetical protein
MEGVSLWQRTITPAHPGAAWRDTIKPGKYTQNPNTHIQMYEKQGITMMYKEICTVRDAGTAGIASDGATPPAKIHNPPTHSCKR